MKTAEPTAAWSATDRRLMRRALSLAETARGRTSPNPVVGAVVLDTRGAVVGEGFHQRPGQPHAEVVALRAAGERARGGTLYVTLEPCNHLGRTPPCTDAIVAAGLARVVVAVPDPNPRVPGGGADRLRATGIRLEKGCLAEAAARQIAPFASLVTRGRPLVTLKLAASLDGRLATAAGESRWITGPRSREAVHEMRDAADAVMVGVGTVVADDPLLTARIAPSARLAPRLRARLGIPRRPLWRVVVDPSLRMPETARVLVPDGGARTLVACGEGADGAVRARLEGAGVEVLVLPWRERLLDLGALLDDLGRREVADLLVEGGPGLAGGLVDQRLVDRVALFYAPILIGGAAAPGMVGGRGAVRLLDALRLVHVRRRRVGDDLLVEADVVREAGVERPRRAP